MTITEFLLARIAEDETTARAALEDTQRWKVRENRSLHIDTGSGSYGWDFGGGSGVWMCDDPDDDCDEFRRHALNEAEHITRHDPARVLAECAAKRAIVGHFDDPDYDDYPLTHPKRAVLRHLATVYADHPDYRQEWKP